MAYDRLDVEPVLAVDAAADIRDRDHAAAELADESREPRPDVSESLDGDGGIREVDAEILRRLLEAEDAAAARRGFASERPAELDRLSGHDCRRVAVSRRVGVHHPGHRLRIRIHVGRGDVAVRPEDVADLLREAPGQALLLADAHRSRVALDAALRASERDVHEGRLPRHERRKRADLVDIGIGVVADAALVRTARGVVLDAIAGEDVEPAVVHSNGDLNSDLAVCRAEDFPHLVREPDVVGRAVEEEVDGLGRVELVLGRRRGRGRRRRRAGLGGHGGLAHGPASAGASLGRSQPGK